MGSDFTFLIPHAESPFMLEACLDSIRKFHDDKIIISQHSYDNFGRNIEWLAHRYNADYIYHEGWFGDACFSLFEVCTSKYAVYIENDCIVLKSLQSMMEQVQLGGFLGVEEVIPIKEGIPVTGIGPEQKFLRYAPDYYTHSFFVLNMEKFKNEAGPEGIWVDGEKAQADYGGNNPVEPSHGISQVISEWPNKLKLPVRYTDYGSGTVYGTEVFHMWFGGWRFRNTNTMGFEKKWMADVELAVLKDYWAGQFNP